MEQIEAFARGFLDLIDQLGAKLLDSFHLGAYAFALPILLALLARSSWAFFGSLLLVLAAGMTLMALPAGTASTFLSLLVWLLAFAVILPAFGIQRLRYKVRRLETELADLKALHLELQTAQEREWLARLHEGRSHVDPSRPPEPVDGPAMQPMAAQTELK